ncbi:putative phage-related protein [Pseudomonas amygdali pv. mori]|uniref:Putative phage-related protein n=1 Tax=Pseudomonas amygdali pv. mori TaxID=34065 RepID=A0A3M5J659_PSEA0|nr:hypothetical protein [Pseudomonas amygdali]RMT18818.1 putative phage-related protein [Pseudomonas amygdali pv. mori]
MNKIQRPNIDDAFALTNLAANHRVSSYPHLQTSVAMLHHAYAQYEAAQGNAFAVLPVPMNLQAAAYLKAHFKSPPQDLQHIKTLRQAEEHRTCPMCGSLHRGTLDHLLPQSDHSAFVVFSLNLVPACKCNSIRQNLLIGPNPGERILHPYFDHCLRERLVRADFQDLGLVPKISLQLCVDGAHPEFAAVRFHVRSIVQRTAVLGQLNTNWANLCRKPSLVIRALNVNPTSHAALQDVLQNEIETLDDAHDSKNNWYSMFVAGLLEPPVLAWLFQQLNTPGRLPNGPLPG